MEFLRNIDLDIAALIMLIMVYTYVIVQYSTTSRTGRGFRRLVLSMMIYTIFDIVSEYATYNGTQMPKGVILGSVSMYFFFEFATALYYNNYVECILMKHRTVTLKYVIINFFPVMIFLILLAVNLIHPLFFSVLADGNLEYYPFFYLSVVILAYYYVKDIYLIIRKRKSISRKQVFSLLAYIITVIIGTALESAFTWNKLFLCFCLSIAAFQMMITLEAPDYQKLQDIINDLEVVRNANDEAVKRKNRFSANLDCEIARGTERIIEINKELAKETSEPEVKELSQSLGQAAAAIISGNN